MIAATTEDFADVVLTAALTEYLEWLPTLLKETPMLSDLRARVTAQPGIAAYLNSPQHYPIADSDYVVGVARVFQRDLPSHIPDANRFVQKS